MLSYFFKNIIINNTIFPRWICYRIPNLPIGTIDKIRQTINIMLVDQLTIGMLAI